MKRVLGVILTLALASSVLGSEAVAEEGVSATLRATGPTSVPLGDYLHLEAEFENTTSEALLSSAILAVGPVGGEPVEYLKSFRTIPADTGVTLTSKVAASKWFAEPGEYEITLPRHPDAAPLRFQVTEPEIPFPSFEDVTAASGIEMTAGEGSCGRWAAGAAWGDVDLDGDLDLFVPTTLVGQLWINQDGHFVDEGVARGVPNKFLAGLGATMPDYDNDGDPDIYVTVDGTNLLLENDGTGHFEDVTEVSGLAAPGPSQSASWGDYDADGYLDLYVANHALCGGATQPDYLFHNEGGGVFSDQTARLTRTGEVAGAGFVAGWFDYNKDGRIDIYLANDFFGLRPRPNFLWKNNGPSSNGHRFKNVSLETGTGVSINSMGIGLGDYDHDLDIDIALSNIYEPVLLQNDGAGRFEDVAHQAQVDIGLQKAAQKAITWGVTFGDFNNDTWEDLYFPAGRLGSEMYQPNQLYLNARDGTFLDASAPSGADHELTSRGAALADYDRDGLLDMFVAGDDGSPVLYRNRSSLSHHWLEVDTIGRSSNRDGCGTTLIITAGNTKQLKVVSCGGTSLASWADPTVHFGLRNSKRVKKLVLLWPSGKRQVLRDLKADRLLRVKEKR